MWMNGKNNGKNRKNNNDNIKIEIKCLTIIIMENRNVRERESRHIRFFPQIKKIEIALYEHCQRDNDKNILHQS